MLDVVIDNLSRGEDLIGYIPLVIQVSILLLWIYIIRRSKVRYETSLIISLFLLFLSIITMLLNQTFIAGVLGEYTFLFMTVGIIQTIFAKANPTI